MLWEKKEINRLKHSFQFKTEPQLRDIKLMVTGKCNLKCCKCDCWKTTTEDSLSTADVNKIVFEAVNLGLKEIQLSGGEPTLRKDLVKIVHLGNQKGVKFSIVTNGTVLNHADYKTLAFSGLKQWTISLDNSCREKFFEVTNSGNGFQRVIDSITSLVEIRNLHGSIDQVNVISVVTKKNFRQLPKLVELVYSLGVNSIRLLPYDFQQSFLYSQKPKATGLNLDKNDIYVFNNDILPGIKMFSREKGITVHPSDNLFIYGNNEVETALASKGFVSLGFYEKNICFMPWHHLAIFPDGSTYICCKKAGMKLGNVKNETLEKIFFNENIQKARRSFKNVDHFQRCKRCASKLFENNFLMKEISN